MKFFKLLFSSLNFWFFLNIIFLISVLLLKFYTIIFDVGKANDAFNVIFNFLSGGVISFLFYFLVVYLPEQNRARMLKDSVLQVYKNIRKSVLYHVVRSSIFGGRDDLDASYDEIARLSDVRNFRTSFSVGELGTEGFSAFENQMSYENYEFDSILQEIKLLHTQISFFLNNYQTKNQKEFNLIKGLEIQLLSLLDAKTGYDESKLFCNFIYHWFSGFDFMVGYVENDRYLEALKKI